MTAFGAASSLVRPVCKLVGNGKTELPLLQDADATARAPTVFEAAVYPNSIGQNVRVFLSELNVSFLAARRFYAFPNLTG